MRVAIYKEGCKHAGEIVPEDTLNGPVTEGEGWVIYEDSEESLLTLAEVMLIHAPLNKRGVHQRKIAKSIIKAVSHH